MIAKPSCFWFEVQEIWRAFSRALAKTGKRIAARIAIIAITTRSSISVKARRAFVKPGRLEEPHGTFLSMDRPPVWNERMIPPISGFVNFLQRLILGGNRTH